MKKFLVKIKTKYNFIELIVDDISTPELKELFDQPYVEEVYIETTEHYRDDIKVLKHVRE